MIDNIDSDTLEDKLDTLIKQDNIDYTSAKLILKALRATGVDDATAFVEKFSRLLYFVPRDFCVLLGALAQQKPEIASDLADKLIPLSLQKPYVEMTLARIWVNHLFVTNALPITDGRFRALAMRDTVIERRQALLLRGRLNDRAYFREAKTRFADVSDWEKPALLLAASCLASSEYDTWLGTCKERYSDILRDEYLNWLRDNKDSLFSKLDVKFTIKSFQQRLGDLFTVLDEETIVIEAAVDPFS